MSGSFSRPRFHTLPPAFQQLIRVFPHQFSTESVPLIFYLYLMFLGIDYLWKNRISDGNSCQQGYRFGGGVVGVEGQTRTIAPWLVEVHFLGQQIHVGKEGLEISPFGLLLLVSLDNLAHSLSQSHRGVVAAGKHQPQHQLKNSEHISRLQLSGGSWHICSFIGNPRLVWIHVDVVFSAAKQSEVASHHLADRCYFYYGVDISAGNRGQGCWVDDQEGVCCEVFCFLGDLFKR